MVKVSVPATSANIGSGFDSCGLALSLYNTAAFEEFDGVDITSSDGTFVPSTPGNLIYRTAKVQHCIIGKDTYFARMVKQESYLLFLRKKNAPQKPYYTLEVEPNGTVRQKRTYFDRQNPDIKQAEKFLLRWQKQLSRKLNKEDKILSLKSRDLRKREIEDLREKKVKVNGFGFTGKLLADILEEDLMENAA